MKCRRQGQAEHAEERWSNIYQANPAGDATSGKDRTREFEEQGDANGFVVEKDAMHRFAVGAERLAVIRHDHDQRALVQAALSKIGEQLAQRSVGIGNLSVVGVLKRVSYGGEDRKVRAGRTRWTHMKKGDEWLC